MFNIRLCYSNKIYILNLLTHLYWGLIKWGQHCVCINMRGLSLLFQRRPLLQPGSPSEVTEAESARRPPSAHNGKPCLRVTSALKCCTNSRIFFYFMLFFLSAVFCAMSRCADSEKEWKAGDETGECARVGSEIYWHGRDIQWAAGTLWSPGWTHQKVETELRQYRRW